MAAFYAVINFSIGWYANTGICVYNFAISIYGLLVWRGIIQSKERLPMFPNRHLFLKIWIINIINTDIRITIASTVVTGTLHMRHRKSYSASGLVVLAIQVPCIPESKKRVNNTGNIGTKSRISDAA